MTSGAGKSVRRVEVEEGQVAEDRSSRSRTHQVMSPGMHLGGEVDTSTRNERPSRELPVLRGEGEATPYREPKALLVQREDVEDLIVPLYPDRSYVFGRAPESTVVFPQTTVSRQHGRLSFREDHRWVYRDLNSRNGS